MEPKNTWINKIFQFLKVNLDLVAMSIVMVMAFVISEDVFVTQITRELIAKLVNLLTLYNVDIFVHSIKVRAYLLA